ncbi:response regulator transcription factor [Herbiconiux moechotypicola]|uniref:Response regulator transcription factor n=1 Tax=Herbiconiux moechotypicola TaxID=637393 RepID=A0ABN3DR23_9MICO|nr:response regulator transcription factor [Herbiconiux moechotypicola]MCS5731753.1 response regulator transcription factor [Herbiconiux moechotypicola]
MGVRVCVVEDQPLYRQMLTGLLGAAPGVVVEATADSFAEAIRVELRSVDVALVDVHLGDGDGIDLGLALRRRRPETAIVLLSASDSSHRLLALPASERGHWSYLSKTSALSASSLVGAIASAASGRSVIDRSVLEGRAPVRSGPLDTLTARQLEVLRLLSAGLTNAAIAEELGIAVRSVDNHVNAVYEALGVAATSRVNPRVSAAALFLEHSR